MLSLNDAIEYTTYGQKTIGMVVMNVESVPNYLLLSENDADAISQIKHIFSITLAEYAKENSLISTSLEIIWSCKPTINQPFVSNIDLKIIFRTVNDNESTCYNSLLKICNSIMTSLNRLKYVISYSSTEKYTEILQKLKTNDLYAIRRPDEIIGFDISSFPYCYKYDSISEFDVDLDLLVSTLINEKNSAVIIQIIPTFFTTQERIYISNCLSILSKISQGVPIPKVGYYKDARAEIPLRTYKKYFEYSASPVFMMNVLTSSPSESAANLSGQVVSLLNNDTAEYHINLEICKVSHMQGFLQNAHASPWLLTDELIKFNRNKYLMSTPIWNSLYRLSSIYTSAEISQVFRLPIGTKSVTAGVTIHEIEKRNKTYAKDLINNADLFIGKLQNVIGNNDTYIGISLKDLTKHMLVVGTPGSGKSTFLVGLMDRLWKYKKIPFLVIEPAKNEYRSLIDSIPDVQVFSPGKNNIAPFIMNPFVPPKGVTIEKYKSIVKSAFSAAFEMWTPLDQLFDETLNICYSEQGLLDSMTIDDSSHCFSMADFIQTYKEVVGSKGYTGEYKKQIEAAGVLRFNGLIEQNANIFDTRYSIPIEDILLKPTIIELSNIKDIKQKSFVIALLLNNIYAFVEANNSNDGNLKNVILIEEAHALLCGDMISQNDTSNANAAAVKLLSDMLAEIRSRGVGIVVADQSPKKVTSAVIGNTNIKVMFRLVEADDKDIVMKSTVMSNVQRDRLSKLKCGQALLFFDKLDEVEEIAMDDYRLKNGISTDLSDGSIKEKMTYWNKHGKLLKPYEDCDCIDGCKNNCSVEIREKARIVADRIFRKYYPTKFSDIKSFAEFYKRINAVIHDEVIRIFKDDKITNIISSCVKVHFLRKVHYNSTIELEFDRRKKIYQSIIKNNN